MKEALKLALYALVDVYDAVYVRSEQEAAAIDKCAVAITAIKEALAQPEQEPSITKTGCGILTLHSGWDDLPDGTKFYTTSPKRPWVELTDEDKNEIIRMTERDDRGDVMALVEAKLKEKNT